MDDPDEKRVKSGWRPGPSSYVPLAGLVIIVGGAAAALLGAGDGAWVVAVLGLFVVLTGFGF